MIRFAKQRGSAPILAILVLIILVVGLVGALKLSQRQQSINSKAATPPTNRINWLGSNWFLNGANVPWYNWSCDFGCNASIGKSGGVSTNMATLGTGFQQLKTANAHMVRWWVFEGSPWQITTDASGAPASINPAVYADFDAALQLAQTYDIYYDFVLFSGPTDLPTAWETDPTQRAKLAQVLGTLFAHYASNPRILSWEIYNEPEFKIWDNTIAQQPVVDTAAAITQSVHTNSPGTLVTIGSGFADGMSMWNGIGLDYYSPHWYPYMNAGYYCIECNTYSTYQSAAENKPVVVGEFPTGDASGSPSSSALLNYWYNNGFAGAWAWSLFPNQTNDRIPIDMTAEQSFASGLSDVGPRAGSTPIPTPTPTTAPTATPVSTASPTPAPTATPAPGSATYSLSPSVTTIAPGGIFSVTLKENSGSTQVNALQAVVTFPSAKVQLTKIDDAVVTSPFSLVAQETINQSAGTVTIAKGSTTNQTGQQVVTTLQFTNTTAGAMTIGVANSPQSAIVATSTNMNILSTPAATSVTVTAVASKVGDFNNDNKVDITDFSIFLSNWNTTNVLTDLNHDGTTNIIDFSIFLSAWGT